MSEVEGRNNRILQLEKQLTAKQDQINQKGNDVEAANSRLNDLELELQSERDKVQQLQQDMSNTQNKLKGAERELSHEKNRLQQLQADISNADSNAAALSKKMMEKSTQLDASNRRCNELEQQVSRLEEQIGGLQGQLRSLQVLHLKTGSLTKFKTDFAFYRFNEHKVRRNNDNLWTNLIRAGHVSPSWKDNQPQSRTLLPCYNQISKLTKTRSTCLKKKTMRRRAKWILTEEQTIVLLAKLINPKSITLHFDRKMSKQKKPS